MLWSVTIVHALHRTVANFIVREGIQLLKVKVPLICLGTEGVLPREEGR
jgi:hypothetical protein